MKKNKIIIILIISLSLFGCVNINSLTYDEVVNTLSIDKKNVNTFKNGYNFYIPKGLNEDDGGINHSVLTSSDITYYLYIDIISYFNQTKIANLLNVCQKTYSDYELGKSRIPIDSLIVLAKFYNVSLDYICGVSKIKNEYPKK